MVNIKRPGEVCLADCNLCSSACKHHLGNDSARSIPIPKGIYYTGEYRKHPHKEKDELSKEVIPCRQGLSPQGQEGSHCRLQRGSGSCDLVPGRASTERAEGMGGQGEVCGGVSEGRGRASPSGTSSPKPLARNGHFIFAIGWIIESTDRV